MKASKLLAGKSAQQKPVPRKRKSSAFLKGRRPETQPWRRGRIRPSTCKDLAVEE